MGLKWYMAKRRRKMPERENMYTMKDFLDGKIAALISNQRQWNDFIDLCEKHGATFGCNSAAKEWTHDWKRKKEVIICRDCKRLVWGFEKEALEHGKKIVHVNELLCPAVQETCPIPDYQIIITCWGDTTHADMFANGHKVKEAKAKRNPADKFNWRIGAQTAFERLWEKKKPYVKEVKRHAMPGEWVKVVNATVDYNNEYKNGDILQIVKYYGNDEEVAHYKNKPSKFLYDSEYVVLEGYKPE